MIGQCPKCGNLVSDKATVCPSCGASLTALQESAPKEKVVEKEAPVKQPEVKDPHPTPEKGGTKNQKRKNQASTRFY